MYSKTKEKRKWAKGALEGMLYYNSKKSKITHLILSKNPEHKVDLFRCFELLIPRMLNYSKTSKYVKVTFTLAMVNHQHMHILIKRPYTPFEYIKKQWVDIMGNTSSDVFMRLVGAHDSDIKKVVNYIMNQGNEHETTDVLFITHPDWGKKISRRESADSDVITVNKSSVKLIYDPVLKIMREETEEDREKQKDIWKKLKESGSIINQSDLWKKASKEKTKIEININVQNQIK